MAEVIDDQLTFNPTALAALREFSAAGPWRGDVAARQGKFERLHRRLCEVYGLDPRPTLTFEGDHRACSGRSCFIPATNTIVLRGRLSVVSYAHELAHARGMNEREACRWSVNLFRRVWPRLYARCRHDGHMLRAPREAPVRS